MHHINILSTVSRTAALDHFLLCKMNGDQGSRGHKRRRQESPARNSNNREQEAFQSSSPTTSSDTRASRNSSGDLGGSTSLAFLGLSKSWRAAEKRAKTHPHEATYGCTSSARRPLHLDVDNNNDNNRVTQSNSRIMASSPLAIACRYGAPPNTVRAILNADRNMVRRCIPNRGTPLHEAIMNYPSVTDNSNHEEDGAATSNSRIAADLQYVDTIRMLIGADEQLESEQSLYNIRSDAKVNRGKRAVLMQDVDGNVPLHLLIRQAFYNYLTSCNYSSASPSASSSDSETKTQHPLLAIIHDLIHSCPSASAKPDCTEFEETPLVLVLKSSIYTTDQHHLHHDEDLDNNNQNISAELERRIFEICKKMLHLHPYAASFVASKSGYTAVHSAVFHGRCCDTIRLLLDADCKYRRQVRDDEKKSENTVVPMSAAMRANRFGETPLHFATMRGECTRTIELLSQAAPWAVLKRDEKFGMTPLHWLLARFVDIMYERFEKSFSSDGYDLRLTSEGEDDDESLEEDEGLDYEAIDTMNNVDEGSQYEDIGDNVDDQVDDNVSGGDKVHNTFDLEYHRRTGAIDPPVDYMRMRHILREHNRLQDVLMDRVIQVLQRVRERHRRMLEAMKNIQSCPFKKESYPKDHVSMMKMRSCPFKNDSYPINAGPIGTEEKAVREEQMISLFWAKTSSLLGAAAIAKSTSENDTSNLHLSIVARDEDENIPMLHSTCSSPSPFAIVRLCVSLYPEQLLLQDSNGKLPLHHAACRLWDVREIGANATNGDIASDAPKIILNESARALMFILNSSPEAAKVLDHEGRLFVHHAIDSALKAVVDRQYGQTIGMNGVDDKALFSVLDVLHSMIRVKPETMEAKDSRTGLYPFMQVSAGAAEHISKYDSSKKSDRMSLSLTFSLLVENPSLATVTLGS